MPEKSAIDLTIQRVVGTSARNAGHYAVQGNLVAYIASGGVVVSKIASQNKSQRFFSANAYVQPLAEPANAYLHMAMPEPEARDSFGFPLGEPLVVSGNNQSDEESKLKDRVRSISCVALAPNGRLLAIGETGYQPRILLFSLAPNSKNSPIAMIHDHAFGLANLEFSPDSRHICSLGVVNDGVFNIWKVGAAVSLVASNRCSSVVNQVVWHEDCIVTFGLRLIKVWQFDEPSDADRKLSRPALLKGKNVILGPYINNSFVCAAVLNPDEILVGTNSHQLLLLRLSDLKLSTLDPPDFNFAAFVVDYTSDKLWFMSDDFEFNSWDTADLKVVESAVMSAPSSPTRFEQNIVVRKLTYLDNNLVYLDNAGSLVLYNTQDGTTHTELAALSRELASVKNYAHKLVVSTKEGAVMEVDDEGALRTLVNFPLPSSGFISNALASIEIHDDFIALGDKLGYLYINRLNADGTHDNIYSTKAHESTISDIHMFNVDGHRFLCSISRDRMIQVFHEVDSQWDILQTLPTHTGNLLRLQVTGRSIVVCSSDKTVSIHRVDLEDGSPAIVPEKIISLKNTPVNMKVHQNELIVSTNDKTLLVYDFKTFELLRTLKLFNDKTNESLLVENFLIYNNQVVVACSDKSLRAFNYHSGKPLSTNWGHSSTILDISAQNNVLTSVSIDGCLFRWNLAEKPEESSPSPIESTPESGLPYAKVTRRIIPSSPTKREEISPTRTNGPRLTTSTIRRMEASRKLELSRPPSPVRRPSSPVREKRNSVSSPGKEKRNSVPTPTRERSSIELNRPSLPPLAVRQSNAEFMEKSAHQLNMIKNYVSTTEMSDTNKKNLAGRLREILEVLDGGLEAKMAALSVNDQLLETYSERLLEMVRTKLNK